MKLEKDKCRNVVSRMIFMLQQDEKWIGLKFLWLPYLYYIYIHIYYIYYIYIYIYRHIIYITIPWFHKVNSYYVYTHRVVNFDNFVKWHHSYNFFSSTHFFQIHFIWWIESQNLFFMYLSPIVNFSKSLSQNIPYKAENWYFKTPFFRYMSMFL